MRGLVGLIWILAASPAAADDSRPPLAVASEATRVGAEYFIQRAGATWSYQLGKGKGRVAINSFVEWKAHVSVSLGKVSGSTTWRAKEGGWFERSGLRAEHEVVVLPAQLSRGTRWEAPASIERGGFKPSTFEVLSLDSMVELPTGVTLDHCLAVLETPGDGGAAWTHFYAANVGKIAVQTPDGWLYRLTEYRSGAKGHAE